MTGRAIYLTHPEVVIDPDMPVTLWPLSETGRQRAAHLAARLIDVPNPVIFSSSERKALDLAEIVSEALGAPIIADHAFGENDRTSTGFLPPVLFEATADRFFANPTESVEGWERAVDAQARIVAVVRAAVADLLENQTAIFCGHGGVGTLLKCHVARRVLSRQEDQAVLGHPRGGNAFAFDHALDTLLSDWQSFESFSAGRSLNEPPASLEPAR